MQKLEVGEIYAPGRTTWPEGVEFNWLNSGPELRLFIGNPISREVSAIKSGLAEFALTVTDDILFILCKFGSMNWIDAPFHISMVPQGRLPNLSVRFESGTRAILQIYLIDASSGILRVIRMVSLSPEFTEQLFSLIRDQSIRPLSRSDYNRAVDSAYEKHPNTESLLIRAVSTTIGGE